MILRLALGTRARLRALLPWQRRRAFFRGLPDGAEPGPPGELPSGGIGDVLIVPN